MQYGDNGNQQKRLSVKGMRQEGGAEVNSRAWLFCVHLYTCLVHLILGSCRLLNICTTRLGLKIKAIGTEMRGSFAFYSGGINHA